MDFQIFKEARELYLKEQVKLDQHSKIYEFLNEKYSEEELNEFWGIGGWLKKNLSPRGIKLKKLAKEYYDWLMQEFRANYKGKDEKELQEFLKKETISDDIRKQMIIIAKKDENYQELANKLIIQYRLNAKKDFFEEEYGTNSSIYSELKKAYAASEKKTKDVAKGTTKKETEGDTEEETATSNTIKEMLESDSLNEEAFLDAVKIIVYIFSTINVDEPKANIDLNLGTIEKKIKEVYGIKKDELTNYFEILSKRLTDEKAEDAIVIAQSYINDGELVNTDFKIKLGSLKSDLIETASKALREDYIKALDIWKSKIENATDKERKELMTSQFLSELFYSKQCTKDPLNDSEIKQQFEDAFYYVLNIKQ